VVDLMMPIRYFCHLRAATLFCLLSDIYPLTTAKFTGAQQPPRYLVRSNHCKKDVRLAYGAKYNAHTSPLFAKIDSLRFEDLVDHNLAKKDVCPLGLPLPSISFCTQAVSEVLLLTHYKYQLAEQVCYKE
jgi:hypothetical protein